ncbi:MAG: SDR family oxidoreductase [Ardenticatenaceae bacterium]|nr:SDR family oxidoreductase [Ardenticatenaceae bacterium]
MTNPSVLITGTSSGIGYDASRYLIASGYRVFGSLRKAADGERVRQELGEQFNPLIFDVTDEAAIRQAAETVKERLKGQPLHGLVNNAGIAVAGPLEHLPLADLRQQFEVNTIGVVGVTQAFLPLLAQPGGRIINISSVSGKIAFPFFGPYAGSKFALEAISASWRRELLLRGIDVIIIGPGSVKTPIWEKAAEHNVPSRYQDTIYREALEALGETVTQSAASGMPVEIISKTILKALTVKRPKTRYALPNSWLSGWLAPLYLPARLIDRVVGKSLKLINGQ